MWIAYKECAYAECHNLIYMYVTIYIYAGLAHGRNKKMREAYNQSRAQFIIICEWGKENMPFIDWNSIPYIKHAFNFLAQNAFLLSSFEKYKIGRKYGEVIFYTNYDILQTSIIRHVLISLEKYYRV